MIGLAAYFSSLKLSGLLNRFPDGISQGIIWGVMALGVFITFRLLNEADLTVDGSFTTGGAVTIMLLLNGWSPASAMAVAIIAGLLAGAVTGVLNVCLGIPVILSGILTQYALYSINLAIMGMKANQAISVDSYPLVLSSRFVSEAIGIGAVIALILIAILYLYFGTEQGSAIRATGCNQQMAKANGINISVTKIIGLALSNGIIAFSGGLMAQFQGFVDINMGRGAIVIGLAAVIIGEVLGDALFGKKMNFAVRLFFITMGGVIYYLVVEVVLWMKLNTNYLKLLTAVIVAVFLAVPYLQGKRKASFAKAKKRSAKELSRNNITRLPGQDKDMERKCE